MYVSSRRFPNTGKKARSKRTYIRIYARRQENIRRFFVPRNKILGPANGTRPTNIPIKYVVIIFSFANVSKSMHSLHLHNQILKKKNQVKCIVPTLQSSLAYSLEFLFLMFFYLEKSYLLYS